MDSAKVLAVGIDFTPGCKAALREALRIASWRGVIVRAIHVIDVLVAAELEAAISESHDDLQSRLVADARQAWAAFAAEIEGTANVAIDVRIDHRVRGILAAARDAEADLLVLGASGSREPDVGIGTVATACVRHAASNVLLVRDTQAGPFKTIVACVDFSPASLLALNHAASAARQDRAALHVLHVFNAPWHRLHYRAPTPEADPHFQRQYRDGLERRLRAIAATPTHKVDFLAPTYALYDHQGDRSGIIDYATTVGADLIVLGVRGHGYLRDMLMGTTAEQVLRDSKCSVLAVRPKHDE